MNIKQVKLYDIENDVEFGGIMLEDGSIICGCCGGRIDLDDTEMFELVKIYDSWIDFSQIIID